MRDRVEVWMCDLALVPCRFFLDHQKSVVTSVGQPPPEAWPVVDQHRAFAPLTFVYNICLTAVHVPYPDHKSVFDIRPTTWQYTSTKNQMPQRLRLHHNMKRSMDMSSLDRESIRLSSLRFLAY
jgi:hypothetical protein